MAFDSMETLPSQRCYRIHSLDMSRELYRMASLLWLHPRGPTILQQLPLQASPAIQDGSKNGVQIRAW